MKLYIRKYILPLLLTTIIISCNTITVPNESSQWDSSNYWFNANDSISNDKVNVIYFYSTEVAQARDAEGNVSLRSLLTKEDLKYINAELQYVKDSMFYDDFNYFAPYYHQYTFEAFTKNISQYDSVKTEVLKETLDAFNYYMEHKNQGRHFILAGFSQGAEIVLNILRNIPPETYSLMNAAYVIGYQITKEDLSYPCIKPATGATERQATISFNSVLDTKTGICDMIAGNAVTCINPVNWRTDSTPASFTYEGRPVTVSIDTTKNVLLIDTDKAPFHEWMEKNPLFSSAGMSKDCLHHWDILFYSKFIHDNALERSRQED